MNKHTGTSRLFADVRDHRLAVPLAEIAPLRGGRAHIDGRESPCRNIAQGCADVLRLVHGAADFHFVLVAHVHSPPGDAYEKHHGDTNDRLLPKCGSR